MNENSAFVNEPIHSTFLPGFEGIPTEPIEKKYLYVLLIQKAIQFVFVVGVWIGVYQFNPEAAIKPGSFILGAILALWTASTTLTLVVFPTRKFLVRTHDVTYEYGKLFYSITTIPVNRIQHVSLGQGPLEKLFNIAHLNIYTAGGFQADLNLPGLTLETAENLKEQLLFLAKNPEKITAKNNEILKNPTDGNELV
ncbi:MAG: PH domain-containing protein [Luteibaculaceae bacterium]